MTARDDNLPIADYDQLPLGTLEQRIRSLDSGELDTLKTYEREHANRTAVTQILESRQDQLRSGAEPSAARHGEAVPPASPRGGSKVTPQTAAPPLHPPPHGTPDQYGKAKGNQA
ncbi:hypothetical protein [Streptomyces sp. NPDC093568]|uniref:hypothetical protein n=1 Tax=Streptomyces sp. NPDC093568 TaxID=3366041 RepID=UPI0038041A49